MIEAGDYPTFRLSPDGRYLAFNRVNPQTGGLDVWLHDFTRAAATRFTSDAADDTGPVWSPDGQRIIFRSSRVGNFLFEKPASGSEPEHLVGTFDVIRPTDWSADGKLVVFHSQSMGTQSWDVGVLPLADRSHPQPQAQGPAFNEFDGRLSPDGRWLAFASDESGRFEIYVQPFPRSGGKWLVSTAGGAEPHWRRDGKELFFLAPDRKLMAVGLRAGTTFESDAPRALFQTDVPDAGNPFRTSYDVTADGTRFLIKTLVGRNGSAINVVMDWTAALKP